MSPQSNPADSGPKDQELPLVLCLKAIAEVIQRNDPCLAITTPPTQVLSNEELSQRVAHALREVCGQSETFGRFSAAELAAANIPPYLEWLRHRLLNGDVAEACLPAGFESEKKRSKRKVDIKRSDVKQVEAQRELDRAEAKTVAHAAAHVDPMVAALNELDVQNQRRQPMPPRQFGPAMAPVMSGMMAPGARMPPMPPMPAMSAMPAAYGLPPAYNMPLPVPNYPSMWPGNPPRGNGKARDDSIARQIDHLQAVKEARLREARPEWTRSRKPRHNPEAGSSKAGSSSKVDGEPRKQETQAPYPPLEPDLYTDDTTHLKRVENQHQNDKGMDTVMTGACDIEPSRIRYQPPTVEDEGWSHVEQDCHMESDDAWEWLDVPTDQNAHDVEIDDCPVLGNTIDDEMRE